MLRSDPRLRPSVKEIFEFEWMKSDGKFLSLSSRKNTTNYIKPQSLCINVDEIENYSKTMNKDNLKKRFNNEHDTKNLLSKFNKVKSGKPPIIPVKSVNEAGQINFNNAASPPLRAVKAISTTNLESLLIKKDCVIVNQKINATSHKTSKNLLNLLLGYNKSNDPDILDSSFTREESVSKTSKKNSITIRGG